MSWAVSFLIVPPGIMMIEAPTNILYTYPTDDHPTKKCPTHYIGRKIASGLIVYRMEYWIWGCGIRLWRFKFIISTMEIIKRGY